MIYKLTKAEIYTFDTWFQKRIEKNGFKPTNCEYDEFGSRTYSIPKKLIHIMKRNPNLPDSERARRSEQMTTLNRKRASVNRVLVHAR